MADTSLDLSSLVDGGFDFMGWPEKSPQVAAILVYVFLVAIIIFIILLIIGMVSFGSKEPYGMPGFEGQTLAGDNVLVSFGKEQFMPTGPGPLELSPTKDFIYDGEDDFGQYRVGKSGVKYYAVKDASGNLVRWGQEKWIMYQALSRQDAEAKKGTALEFLRREVPWSGSQTAKCEGQMRQATNERNIRGKITGYSDPWGWLTAQAYTGYEPPEGEGFQDGQLTQKLAGY